MAIPEEERIWRFDEKNKINTLVFIGNGCISNRNGWKPLTQAIKNKIPQYIKNKIPQYINDPVLSLIVSASQARWSLNVLTAYLRGNPIPDISKPIKCLSEIHQGREYVGKLYREASLNKCVVDDPFGLDISNELDTLIAQNTTLTITTNWDHLLWDDTNIKNLIQLHGRSGNGKISQSILFPTELTKDYRQFYVLNEEQINNDPVFSTIREDLAYRSGALFKAEMLTKHFFEEAVRIKEINKIIISGIKINDYDVELMEIFSHIQCHLIKAGQKLEEIVIINPNNHDADRANILLSGISRRVIQKFETTRIIYEE